MRVDTRGTNTLKMIGKLALLMYQYLDTGLGHTPRHVTGIKSRDCIMSVSTTNKGQDMAQSTKRLISLAEDILGAAAEYPDEVRGEVIDELLRAVCNDAELSLDEQGVVETIICVRS